MQNRLEQVLSGFLKILSRHSIDYALIGGIAVGYWGEERFTKDLDFTIALEEKSWMVFKSYIEKSSDIQIDTIAQDPDAHMPYLIRIHYQNYPIDLIVSLTDFQKSLLSRKVKIDFLSEQIFIASPEDIIVSKLIAGRSQDLVDIEKVVQAIADLDQNYIRQWAKFWEVTEIWNRILQK